jgi:hypothetical protein
MPPIGGPLGLGSVDGAADWLGLSAGASEALGSVVPVAGMVADGAAEVVC